MKKILLLLSVFCFSIAVSAIENIKVGTTTRTMIVYAPDQLPKQAALVIACHGYNQDAPYLQSLAKWETIADTAKFVVVYANGVNKAWDIGGTSDLKFMETIIDSMYSRYHINKNRVYLTGFSMGGMFTYYAANKMADKIAAFAPVSGYPMGGPNAASTRPVPILHTHGTADDVCTYGPVQSHIDAWVKFNGCNTTPEVIKPYPKSKPNSPASLTRYRNGKNGVEVALLTLADKGHWWSMDTAQALTSEEVWNFCKRYSLGADAPEVESVVPENQSFDLLPERDNKFEVKFNAPINAAKVNATLQSEKGTEIVLSAPASGYLQTVTFALPSGTEMESGEYTLKVTNATTKDGGVLAEVSFTYAFGVEEVGEVMKVDTIYCPNWYGERDAIGEGIPAGWKRVNTLSSGSKETTAGGTKDCAGVRMKYFEQGGDFDAGMYMSARDNNACNLYYGTYINDRMSLEKGKYRVAFRSVYWSEGAMTNNASYNFHVMNSSLTPVFSATSLTSTGTMMENTGQKISGSKAYEYDFVVERAGSYVLNFEMAEGWNSVIIGDVLLTTQPSLADTYKGTFYRTMLAAQKAVKGYQGTTANNLKNVMAKYEGLVSTSPSVYTAATKELSAALTAFEASDKVLATYEKVSKSVNIEVNGKTLSYWLYVPKGCKANAPLVVSLHGAGGHSTDKSPMSTSVADAEKFIVVYPQGSDIYFPVFGGKVPGWDATGEENDDVEFLKAIIDDVDDAYAIDRRRVYCCGFSNGGMMAYALTNTCSDIFAAFASISGFPLNEFHFRHTGERPTPFLHIHGKNDDFVRYALMPVIVDEMVARLGANPVPVKTTVSGKYDKSVYEATAGSFPYVYYEVDGMGHEAYTNKTEEGNSAQTMWNFFEQYSLDTPCDETIRWMPRVETAGYNPKQHGWFVNTSTTLLMFGREQNTDGKQNVYHSLQLTTGNYKLKFRSEGEAGKTVGVKIQKLTGTRTVVLNATAQVGGEAVFAFKVEDGWGEYKITLTRPTVSDQISIADLALYTASEDEVTGIDSFRPANAVVGAYTLSGLPAHPQQKGIQIVRTAENSTRKVIVK